MSNYLHRSMWFYGNKISEYGLQNGYIDYRTLSRAFDAVLSNGIIEKTVDIGYWNCENGSQYYYEDDNGNIIGESDYYELPLEKQDLYSEHWDEVFQYYIIDDNGARILTELTDELVWYNEELDLHVWGVTHFGTSWDYVLTNIKIELDEDG